MNHATNRAFLIQFTKEQRDFACINCEFITVNWESISTNRKFIRANCGHRPEDGLQKAGRQGRTSKRNA